MLRRNPRHGELRAAHDAKVVLEKEHRDAFLKGQDEKGQDEKEQEPTLTS